MRGNIPAFFIPSCLFLYLIHMKVTFIINFHTVWGQKLFVVGSIPALGSWDPVFAKEMVYTKGGNWQLVLDLPEDTEYIEYRYFLSVNDKRIFEEWEKNHKIVLDKQISRYSLYDYWQVRPTNLAFYTSAFTKSLFAHPCNTHERVVKGSKHLTLKVAAPRIEKHQSVAITGNQPSLGEWNPDKALKLSCDTFPEWHIDLDASELHNPLEYKFIIFDNNSQTVVDWEDGENRLLDLPPQANGEKVVISGLYFRDKQPLWRGAGSVMPVFSLRSANSFGVGDLRDLQSLIDWAKKTGQCVIQTLPMNDTTMTHTWVDSYPYSAISIYAIHPMYISLTWMGELKDKERAAYYNKIQHELNALDEVDYESVVREKILYCREFFAQEGMQYLESEAFANFFAQNESWLVPYAAYSYLREKNGTPEFKLWGSYSTYDKGAIQSLCSNNSVAYPEIAFCYFLQFVLDTQFRAVSEYARKNGIVLKGDIPIGVNKNSVETWTEPKYFNMNGQAGAPPDDFSENGQNWMFPTYNWAEMEKDGYSWWKKRFRKMSDYFDAFRIDHILGFFRIWEVPQEYVQGLCGHFNPALPFSKNEIEQYGLVFNEARFTTPHIHNKNLHKLFGDLTSEVMGSYLAQSSSNHFVLKPFCDTQRKIEKIFAQKKDEASQRIKEGLYAIANEVLFLADPHNELLFHPRISAMNSFIYMELNQADRYAFDQLYWHFFYRRHTEFWKLQAYKHLTPLVACTDMLVCGEDLGMIPDSVPEVMNKLQILSLEIERMPKTSNRDFADMFSLPYHSVCTTSTHDMTPIRNWWKEDREKTQQYYNKVLLRVGEAPEECKEDLAKQIVSNHLDTQSMLTIIPLQDWFAMDDSIKRADPEAERINVPANSMHYWRYRMHITLEELMNAESLNEKISFLIRKSGRN